MMDVKEAVKKAKTYVADLLADEGLMNLGLEEIEHNDAGGVWYVTVGFSRPWNNVKNALVALTGDVATPRSYRVVALRDSDGEVVSVKRRDRGD